MGGRATFALLALLAAAPAQHHRSQHGPIRTDASGLVLPAGDFTVVDLVEATAAYLCRNYLYDASTLDRADGFALQRPIAVDAIGSEDLLYALLSTRGFAVFPVDEARGIYAIVPLTSQAQPGQTTPPLSAFAPWRTREEVLRRPNLREIVSTGILLANADARELATMLAASAPDGWQPGRLFACARAGNYLFLHGYREQIAQVIRVAELLDRGGEARQDDLLARIQRLERELAEVRAELERRSSGERR